LEYQNLNAVFVDSSGTAGIRFRRSTSQKGLNSALAHNTSFTACGQPSQKRRREAGSPELK